MFIQNIDDLFRLKNLKKEMNKIWFKLTYVTKKNLQWQTQSINRPPFSQLRMGDVHVVADLGDV